MSRDLHNAIYERLDSLRAGSLTFWGKWFGGKAKNRATRKPRAKQAVMALVERGGHVRSFHVANVNAKHLRGLIVTNVDRASHLMTDESMVILASAASSPVTVSSITARKSTSRPAASSTATPPKTSSPSSSAA